MVTDSDRLATARAAVESVLEQVDQACSRFREDSELSRVNLLHGTWIEISPLLVEALAAALWAAEATEGRVDPTVGRALRAIGYDRDFKTIPPERPGPVLIESVPGWHSVELDRRGRVRVPPGVELDLGATGKSWAADRAAAEAHARGVEGVLVCLGGDIALGGGPPEGGWPIEVAGGDDPEAAEVTVWIDSGGIATSSTRVRRWRQGGTEIHHILDPSTGLPARGPWSSVTVAAATCLEANAAATNAIIAGEGAVDWLARASLPSRLVRDDGTIVITGGWPR